jgi:hypothetical protein
MNSGESSTPPPSASPAPSRRGGRGQKRPRANRTQSLEDPQCRDRTLSTEELNGKPLSVAHKDSKKDLFYQVLARTYLWEFYD